ncbi:MAG: SDR family oxidoreductase [Chloroflexia bacterium]|nr:SDR family oxidoreductase [Chloroflexia bacterium]
MRIGITGHSGFIGTHLKNFLSLEKEVTVLTFEDADFDVRQKLQEFVAQCDAIVHLAAINRHPSPQYIFEKNVELVKKVTDACIETESKPHILFSSSIQEERDNEFGNSKKAGRELLEKWATECGSTSTGMVIPNVFGPFGKPYYNSVVATFCHQLTHGEEPSIQIDGELPLIYVNDLASDIFDLIKERRSGKISIQHRYKVRVSEILELLKEFKKIYFEQGAFPDISTPLRLALFNTFRCYIPNEHYPFPFKLNPDDRGTFVEITRAGSSGQFSYSTTNPNVTRGNHFHTRKAERFAVIKGKAKISMRRIDCSEVINYIIDGANPAFVDMPIWHTHNITNIGDEELLTLFWINEPYNAENPDTYFVNV